MPMETGHSLLSVHNKVDHSTNVSKSTVNSAYVK